MSSQQHYGIRKRRRSRANVKLEIGRGREQSGGYGWYRR